MQTFPGNCVTLNAAANKAKLEISLVLSLTYSLSLSYSLETSLTRLNHTHFVQTSNTLEEITTQIKILTMKMLLWRMMSDICLYFPCWVGQKHLVWIHSYGKLHYTVCEKWGQHPWCFCSLIVPTVWSCFLKPLKTHLIRLVCNSCTLTAPY